MIRVIYRWQVASQNVEQFQRAWTIAKWDSMEAWKSFWGMENPPEMATMNKLGKRLSATAWHELDDFTR